MEHAVRSQVRKHHDKDPVLYRKLSQHLEQLLKKLDGNWDEQVKQLQKLIDAIRAGRTDEGQTSAELPAHYLPFLRTMLADVCGEQEPAPEQLRLDSRCLP